MAQNPMFNEAAFERAKKEQARPTAEQERELRAKDLSPHYQAATGGQVMTLQGTINKTFILLALCVAGGYVGWIKGASFGPITLLLLFGAFILAIWTSFKPSVSPVTSPIYAFMEGAVLGALSAAYNALYEGIVLNAVLITVLVFAVMFFVYKTGILKVTQGFATAVFSATAAIAIMYLGSWIFSLFGGNI